MLQRSTSNKMTTISECLEQAKEKGYTAEFEIRNGELAISGKEWTWSPEHIQIDDFNRFEGVSDPADSMILYLIRTNDDTRGTLSDGYGAYADENKTEFIKKVEQISKKI